MAGLGLSESVGHIHQLIPLLRNAIYLATSSYRCAHLAVPIDVQLNSVTAPRILNFRQENLSKHVLNHASSNQIRALATALIKERMNGHHMVIFCGWRAYPYGDAIEQLAEFLDVPIITSFDGKGEVK
jgi:thiamine pyrophosphate-dependent acetolactate synthase large subunit-like protein